MPESLGTLSLELTANSTQLKREIQQTEAIAKAVGVAIAKELAGSLDGAAAQIRAKKSTVQSAIGQAFDGDYSSIGQKVGQQIARGIHGALDSAKSSVGSILQGIFQGIGQSIYGTISNAVGGSLKYLTDFSSVVQMSGAQAGIKSLGADVNKVTQDARDLAKELKYAGSSRELLQASYGVISSGFKGDEAKSIVKASKRAATAGVSKTGAEADLDVVADATTTILNSYKMSASDAEKVTSQMVATVNLGKIEMGQYASMIGNVATTAAQAGVPLEEMNAFIANATVSGVKAESAITGFRQAIVSVLKPSADAAKYAEELGVGFDAATLKSKGMSGILEDLRAKGADGADSLIRLFGSVEAVTAIAPSAGDGLGKLKQGMIDVKGLDITKALDAGASSMSAMQAKTAALREELDLKFKSSLAPVFEAGTNALNQLLEKLVESQGLFDGLLEQSNQFKAYLEGNPQIIEQMSQLIQELIQQGVSVLLDLSKQLLTYLQQNPQALQQAVNSSGEFLTTMKDLVINSKPLLDVFAGIVSLIGKAITGLSQMGILANGIGEGLKAFVDGQGVEGFMKAAKGSVSGATQPEATPSSSGGRAGSPEQFVGAVLSILEAPSRQGRVDVAQVIANRSTNNFGGNGSNVRDQAFASGQFQPFFKETYGIGKNDIQDRSSAVAALQKAGYSVKQAEAALNEFFADVNNMAMVADTQGKVKNKVYFKGVSQYGNMQAGDFLRNQGENFFHDENSDSRKYSTASVNSTFGGGGGGSASTLSPAPAPAPSAPKESTDEILKRLGISDGGFVEGSGSAKKPSGKKGNIVPFKGVQVTSAVDASGEPGLDYVVEDGRKGAKFGALAAGKVVETKTDQNWESHLEAGDTRRGYGNQVIVRTVDKQTGEFVDMLYAHLGKVAVEVGQEVGVGEVLGTQGRTGSTTGAHVSVDFFKKDSNASGSAQIAMRDRIAQQLASGKYPTLSQGGSSSSGDVETSSGSSSSSTKKVKPDTDTAIEAARKLVSAQTKADRDKKKKLQEIEDERAEQRLKATVNSAPDSESKRIANKTLERVQIDRKYAPKLEGLQNDLDDLQSAKSKKVASKKTGGVDYSAAIKDIQTLIEETKRLKAEETSAGKAGEDSEEKRDQIAKDRERRNAATAAKQKSEILELQKQQALTKSAPEKEMIGGSIETVQLQIDIENSMQPLKDALEDLMVRKEYLMQIGADKTEMAKLDEAIKAISDRMGEVSAQGQAQLEILGARQIELEETRDFGKRQSGLSFEQMKGNSKAAVMSGASARRREAGDTFGANDLDREVGIMQEELRHRQALLDIERQIKDLRSQGIDVSESDINTLKSQADQLHNLNMDGVKNQFKTLGQTVGDISKNAFGQFFQSVLTGSQSVGDAFKGLVSSMLSQLAQLAVNSLFSNLFGGKSGGGGLGGLFGGGGGSSGGGGGLLGGLLGGGGSGGGGGIFGSVISMFSGGFADGGTVGAPSGGGYGAIAKALRKEGSNAVLAALTPGEIVLNLKEAAQYRKAFPDGIGQVYNFSSGGIVGGSSAPAMSAGKGQGMTINTPITVNTQGDSSGVDAAGFQSIVDSRVQQIINQESRPGGSLNRS